MNPRRWSVSVRGVRWILVTGVVLASMFMVAERGLAQASDPMEVFNGLHAAVNAHDLDGALAFFAPDAVVEFTNQPPPNVHRGTEAIRTWLAGDIAQNIQVTTRNVQVAGDRLSWDASVVVDDVRPLGFSLDGSVEALIQGGKIMSFAFTLSEETLAKLASATPQPQTLPQTGGALTPVWWLLGVAALSSCGLGLALRRRMRG